MLFLNYCIFSGSAEALVIGVVGNNSIYWLLTLSVTHVPNIMKIRQCFLELWLKMSGMFLRHTVVVVVVVYWQKCGQRNRDTTRIAVKNKT